MKFKDALELLQKTNDKKSVKYILNEFKTEIISEYSRQKRETQDVMQWVKFYKCLKPEYNKHTFFKCKNGKIKLGFRSETDNKYYTVGTLIDITNSIVYFGKIIKNK